MGLLWKALLNLQLIQAIAVCLLSTFSYLHHDALKQDTLWGTKHPWLCVHMQEQGARCGELCASPQPCAGEEPIKSLLLSQDVYKE